MIPYLVPMPMTGDIPGRTRKSIEAQTEPVQIVECRTPGEDKPAPVLTDLRRTGERTSRELCQAEAAKITPAPEYVVIADPDRSHENSNNGYTKMVDNILDARLFLDVNPDYGAVSLTFPSAGRDADDKNPHIDIGVVIYRYPVFAALNFDKPKAERCYCAHVTRQIRKMGLRFGYLDSEKNRTMPV
jgi:hypothetical protein